MAAPFNLPLRGAAFTFKIALEEYATPGRLKTDPTIAAGDFKVQKDAGTEANLTTLPAVTNAGSALVTVSLSAAEMTADVVTLKCRDATATPEWCDLVISIPVYKLDKEIGVKEVWTAAAGGTGSITAAGGVTLYVGEYLEFIGGTGAGQAAVLTTGTSGTAGVFETPIAVAIDATTVVRHWFGAPGVPISEIVDSIDLNSSRLASIDNKTANLPTDPADASVVAGLIAAVEAKVDTVDNLIDTEVAALQSDLTAVKAKTDNLPTDPADASVVAGLIAAVEAKVDTVDNFLDTEVAAIISTLGTPAGASLAVDLAAVKADTVSLLTTDTAYKRATAVTGFMFPMRLTAGPPATGVAVTVQVSKDGAAFATVAASSGIATEVSGGWYKIDLSGSEMTADEVALKMTGTGCSQLDVKIRTQS